MFNLTIGTKNNTYSQPFYSYATDELYVGDNDGKLWKVETVFTGTPTLAAAPWNNGVVVDSGQELTGPVLDYATGNILVADLGGQVTAVNSTTGAIVATLTGQGVITDPPIVDSTTGQVFVFSGGGGSLSSSVVLEADTSLNSPTTVNIGTNSSGTHVHAGTFDNTYFSSVNSTGNLYVCGKQTSNSAPALYSISIVNGSMNGINGGPFNLTTNATAHECSPLAEIFNPNQTSPPNENAGIDWLFVGIPVNCAFGGASTGCLTSFDITGGFPSFPFAVSAERGGTTGMIEDNISTAGQASSVYFTTLTSPGAGGCDVEPAADSTTCLVKRTQAGLQ
jgi:hypothetical protein